MGGNVIVTQGLRDYVREEPSFGSAVPSLSRYCENYFCVLRVPHDQLENLDR